MKIKEFIKDRNEALLSGDIDQVIAFYKKWNPKEELPNRKIIEISMHKARTAAVHLPRETRLASKRWLKARGYLSLDDGDLDNLDE